MVKKIVMGAAALLAILGTILCWAHVADFQRAFPADTQVSLGIDFPQTAMSPAEILTKITESAIANDLYVYKVTPRAGDEMQGRDLFAIGKVGETLGPITSIDPNWKTQLKPLNDFGITSVRGMYLVKGITDSAQLSRFTADITQTGGVFRATKADLFTAMLQGSNARFTPVVWATMFIVLIAIVLLWYVNNARRRILRTLGGARQIVIGVDALLGLYKTAVPSFLAVQLLGCGAAFLVGGAAALALFAKYLFWYDVVALLGLGIVGMVVSLLSRAPEATFARRETPVKHFLAISTINRTICLLGAMLALPGFYFGITLADAAHKQNQYWESLTDFSRVWVSISQGAEADKERIKSFTESWQKEAGSALSFIGYDKDCQAADVGGVVFVDEKYLTAVVPNIKTKTEAVAGIETISMADVPAGIRPCISENLKMWTQEHSRTPSQGMSIARLANQGVFPGLDRAGTIKLVQNPILVVAKNAAESYDADFISAKISSGNIIFSGGKDLAHALNKAKVGDVLTGVERAGDTGIIMAQVAKQQIFYLGLLLIIILAALLGSCVLSAQIWVAKRHRMIFCRRVCGDSWISILRRRVIFEVLYIVSLAAIVATVWYAFAESFNIYSNTTYLSLLILVPLYLLVSLGTYLFQSRKSFNRVVLRQPIG